MQSFFLPDYRMRTRTGRLGVPSVVRLTALLTALLISMATPLATACGQQVRELHIAAAADLTPVLPALAAEYEKQTGVRIIASFGSSATLTQQLENGAPEDVFLSADYLHPEELVAAGLSSTPQPRNYARGVLVLWARKDSPAQPLSLDVLTSPRVQKIAVANDLHAPYGLAATRALASLHLTEVVKPKLVVAENIAQTAQFAESGNAQVALISLTIASSAHFRELGTFVRFPREAYPPVLQCGIVLKASRHPAEAEAFLAWLTSAAIQQRLPAFGLDPAQ